TAANFTLDTKQYHSSGSPRNYGISDSHFAISLSLSLLHKKWFSHREIAS
ncbi:unnamed protein product, partial [Musa hybrid cultivar]